MRVGTGVGIEVPVLVVLVLELLEGEEPLVLLVDGAGGEEVPLVAAEAVQFEGVARPSSVEVGVASVQHVEHLAVVQRQTVFEHQRVPLHQFFLAEDELLVEEVEEDVAGPAAGGDLEELALAHQTAVAGADVAAQPVVDAALPAGEELLHFGASFALVHQIGHRAHRVQCVRHQLTVAVILVGVFEKFGQLERVLADLLNGGEEESLQRQSDHAPQEPARLEESQVAHVVVQLLHLHSRPILIVAVRRINVKLLHVFDEATADDTVLETVPVE